MNRIKIILLFITFLTLRPAVLGEDFTIIGILACGLALYLHLIQHSLQRQLDFRNDYLPTVVMVSVYWVYIITQATLTNSPIVTTDILKGVVTGIISIVSFSILLSDESLRNGMFKLFIRTMIILSVSYMVTMLLSLVIPLPSLELFKLYIDGNPKTVYFPITPIYGVMTVQDHIFQRFMGIFRESGISQSFMIWALMSLPRYGMDSRKNKLILLFGIAATFSTAGIAVYLVTVAVRMILNKRFIFPFVVIPAAYYTVMYAPYVGIANKLVTHSTSISDRTIAMRSSWEIFSHNILGIGIGNSPLEHASINLISSLHMIGIIGLSLVLAIYFMPMFTARDKKSYLLGIIPLFVTALVSQPIYDSPIMFVMVIVSLYESRKALFFIRQRGEYTC
jgi:hypothetical protein